MSFKKKNWTALSSLAQQWNAEDVEEQERERRRRHRQHGSISEVKEEISSPEKQNTANKAPQSLAQQWRAEDEEEQESERRQRHRQHGSISEVKEEISSPEKHNAVKKAPQRLTQQWRAEDEEEQKRECRQRHRQHCSISEIKEEISSPEKQNTVNQAPQRFCVSSEAKPSKLWNSKQESESISTDSTDNEEDRSVRRRIEIFNNVQQNKKETVNTRKFGKEAVGEKMRTFSQPAQEQKKVPVVEKCECLHQEKGPPGERQENLGEEEKEVTLKKQKSLDQEKKERILTKHDNLVQEVKEPQMAKDEVFRDEENTPNAHASPKLAAIQNDVAAKQPQRASWERRSISRLEVKIQPRIRNTTETAAATTSSRPQVTEKSIPKSTEKSIPKSTDEAENCHSVFVSRPLVTYSSSFKRIAPRTISFRVVSRKDKQEDTLLSRSASMRLPVNPGKLDEKLEKYTSAVQRAGSIKLPPSARKNFQAPLEGVASKRSIFEANVSSRAEPTTLIRKESLKLPGGVTSRINLWISRTQEPSKDDEAKEVQRIDTTSQQNQWRKQSDDS